MVRRPFKREESFADYPFTMATDHTEAGEDILMRDAAASFASSTFPSADGFPTPVSQPPYVPSTDVSSYAMSFRSDDGSTTSTILPPVARLNADLQQDADRIRRSGVPTPQESGLNIVGARVQVLVNAINDFRELGVDHVVQLPELVLVGDQSAGKSSLMGALAEIHLPQSSGCCTRCPAHITTEPADQWKCDISLHQYYTYEPRQQLIEPRHVTRNQPFPPWIEQQLVTKPFKTIYRKQELEEVLKWAQLANLNHNKDHRRYVPGSSTFARDENIDAKFSPNVVSVKISGPGLPPLSFFDLPGIFQNPGQKADGYLVKVIENLAKKYIEHPQALIIYALPMSADPATSRTGKVIADCRAEKRCIGVLTKADRLQVGQSHTDFERILNCEDHQVGHGYFVTKQPGQTSLRYDDQYHTKARVDENDFFATHEPWASQWSQFSHRCGTKNLQHALSQKFAVQIVDSLPTIKQKIRARAEEIETELQKLPELPTQNVLHVVTQQLFGFARDMQDMLASDLHGFLSSWNQLCEQFRNAVFGMKPGINVSHESDMVLPEVINIDDGDDCDVPNATPKRKHTLEDPATPSPAPKMMRGLNNGAANPIRRDAARKETPGLERNNGLPNRAAPENTPRPASPVNVAKPVENPDPFAQYLGYGRGFTNLSEIRQKISKYRRTGVPGHVNLRVQDELCMQSVTGWSQPTDLFIQLTFKSLREEADVILDKYLSHWKQTELYKEARAHLESFMNDFEVRQRATATELVELETYKLFTVNEAAFKQYEASELAHLLQNRHVRRAMAYVQKQEQMGLVKQKEGDAKKLAYKAVKREQLGEDPLQTEINVAAFVRGYYLTAASRFTEHVCLSVHGKLFKQARHAIHGYLNEQLGLTQGNGEERCKELMEENTDVAVKRQALKREKESLQQFTDRLLLLAKESKALDDEEMA